MKPFQHPTVQSQLKSVQLPLDTSRSLPSSFCLPHSKLSISMRPCEEALPHGNSGEGWLRPSKMNAATQCIQKHPTSELRCVLPFEKSPIPYPEPDFWGSLLHYLRVKNGPEFCVCSRGLSWNRRSIELWLKSRSQGAIILAKGYSSWKVFSGQGLSAIQPKTKKYNIIGNVGWFSILIISTSLARVQQWINDTCHRRGAVPNPSEDWYLRQGPRAWVVASRWPNGQMGVLWGRYAWVWKNRSQS